MVKQKIIHSFNLGAKEYDSFADIQVIAAEHLANQLNVQASHILEIGCGTGLFTQYLLKKFPDQDILLTDIAPEMIKVTRDKWMNTTNIKFACMDGENIPAGYLYDLIVSNMTMHWFSNLMDSIKNMMHLLKTGGKFAFSLLGEGSLIEWRERYPYTWVFPKIEELKDQFPDLNLSVKSYSKQYHSAYTFLKTLKKIGGMATHHSSLSLSSGKLRSILRSCDSPFNVTYEVIYGHYTKLKL